ncbi:uncharacterized protein SCHCODRAFT_02750441 [Schizophyllum commune H4-8]|uniref:Uncharacterized protein n=1 Tax=Schizophyllum commune (strain H4-8 / FGSC 9210) TaxID=578458 RepID=D8Q8Q8_SCHCM|nr:uncharacterized protein SCHCODRAFT_02750441 [Schizophyllum commune H4-8]KAI5890718.1 hypothetical protein SCHCODRAFT_02750441 [Schizophyllum commune H4-8]
MSDNSRAPKEGEWRPPIIRGFYERSLAGILLTLVGRAADIPIQYLLFKNGHAVNLLVRVGLISQPAVAQAALTTGPGFGGLGPVPTLLLGIYTVTSMRHMYWVTMTNTMYFGPAGAAFVSIYNGLLNAANTFVAAYGASNLVQAAANATSADSIVGWATSLGWQQWTGLGLFLSGIAIEMLSEESRKKFKSDPRNKGKVDGTGLFGVVRHPNYLGYTLWRTGATLATGSVPAAIVSLLFQVNQFSRSIPGLTEYMADRYGQQWTEYEKRVPYKIIPGLY